MLSDVYFALEKEKRELEAALRELPDDGEKLFEEAERRQRAHEAEMDAKREQEEKSAEAAELAPTPIGTPTIPAGATAISTSYITSQDAAKLRLNGAGSRSRSRSASASSSPPPSPSPLAPRPAPAGATTNPKPANIPLGTSLEPSYLDHLHPPRKPDVLSFAPDERIAQLAKNIDLMKDELKSNGEKGLVWPENVTYARYLEFMCMPTLCYQLEYPRTST